MSFLASALWLKYKAVNEFNSIYEKSYCVSHVPIRWVQQVVWVKP